jgi:hypothetical protein
MSREEEGEHQVGRQHQAGVWRSEEGEGDHVEDVKEGVDGVKVRFVCPGSVV